MYIRSPVLNIMSLTNGFFYASFVNNSQNFTICDGNYTDVRYSFGEFISNWHNISNTTNMTNALNALADIMATTYPLTYSCYYGMFEAQETFVSYLTTATQWQTLVFNLFNSMGPLYDTFYYLRGWTKQNKIDLQTNEEVKMYWYRMGAYYGILVNLMLVNSIVTEMEGQDITDWVPIEDTQDPGSSVDNTWLL